MIRIETDRLVLRRMQESDPQRITAHREYAILKEEWEQAVRPINS